MQLKWPNDVYSAGKKCCGILTESSPLIDGSTDRFAIVGIGININSEFADFPQELHDKVTSLRILTGSNLDIQTVLHRVRSRLLEQIAVFELKGFGAILKEWRKRDMLYGRLLQWVSTSGEIIVGRSEGPDEDGRLMVQGDDGKTHQILSGDINLADTVRKRGGSFKIAIKPTEGGNAEIQPVLLRHDGVNSDSIPVCRVLPCPPRYTQPAYPLTPLNGLRFS